MNNHKAETLEEQKNRDLLINISALNTSIYFSFFFFFTKLPLNGDIWSFLLYTLLFNMRRCMH